mgnify:FL=1
MKRSNNNISVNLLLMVLTSIVKIKSAFNLSFHILNVNFNANNCLDINVSFVTKEIHLVFTDKFNSLSNMDILKVIDKVFIHLFDVDIIEIIKVTQEIEEGEFIDVYIIRQMEG